MFKLYQNIILLLFPFLLILGHKIAGSQPIDDAVGIKIVGGEEARPHEFPWLIRIRSRSQPHICGGTVIREDLVLTAAHCIDVTARPETYTVVAGSHNIRDENGQSFIQNSNVRQIVCHQQYDDDTFENDICLLKLSSRLNRTQEVGVAQLADVNTQIPANVTVAGWGVTNTGVPVVSPILMKVVVPTVPNPTCEEQYKGQERITSSMMCAGETGKDSCQGDSGGPLMCANNANDVFVCGIVSFGAGCGLPGYPGVYTRVSAYRNWIAENSSVKSPSFSSSYMMVLSVLIFWLIKI